MAMNRDLEGGYQVLHRGCVLHGRISDDVFTPTDPECDAPATDPFAPEGDVRVRADPFEIDLSGESAILAGILRTTRTIDGVTRRDCLAVEAFAPPDPPDRMLAYWGAYRVDAGHAIGEPCGAMGDPVPTSGNVAVRARGEGGSVYEQGNACSVDVRNEGGEVLVASAGTECELDEDFGLTGLGIVSRVYDEYRIDIPSFTLLIRGEQVHVTPDGTRRAYCFEVEASTTDEGS